jgi:hypothetical protein
LTEPPYLSGARIGILRESIGVQSEPESKDFKKVDVPFERNVAKLKADVTRLPHKALRRTPAVASPKAASGIA